MSKDSRDQRGGHRVAKRAKLGLSALFCGCWHCLPSKEKKKEAESPRREEARKAIREWD